MTTKPPLHRRVADLERQVERLETLHRGGQRAVAKTDAVQLKRVQTTKTTSYPTGYANTFEVVTTDGAWTRTEGNQALTDTARKGTPQFKGRTAEATNVVEDTVLPGFVLLGADGKSYFYLLDFATAWRFTLNEDMGATTAGQASADRLDLLGNDTGVDITVLDGLGIFSSMQNLDAGICLKQGGQYHVIQAECP